MRMKEWRGIATRYAKRSASFLAAIQIRCIALWLSIL
ncbi:MAG: IS5/IS1182 family transposase, partial [Coriobacteriia bacterium]|nr:IS5/IS1182 family transposase [Coriobacteriia bacterium]